METPCASLFQISFSFACCCCIFSRKVCAVLLCFKSKHFRRLTVNRLNRWTLLSLTVLVVGTYGLTQRAGQDDTKMDERAMASRAAIVPEEMEGTYQSLIEQAKIDAQNGHLKEAVLKLEGVPKNSQHSSVAEQLTEETAHALMQRAGNKYQQADLRTALLMLNAVPVSSQTPHKQRHCKQSG